MSYTNAQIVLNSRDATGGTLQSVYNPTPTQTPQLNIYYNDCKFNAQSSTGGQNIIQGSIREIAVSEVNLPYDIPNVQDGFNTFELVAAFVPEGLGADPTVLTIVVPPGFYSGSELATKINDLINAAAVAASLAATDAPTFNYLAVSNQFRMNAPSNASTVTPTWSIFSPYTFPVNYNNTTNTLGKDILSIMGFSNATLVAVSGSGNIYGNVVTASTSQQGTPNFIPASILSGSAPLVFTQYIDVCSDKLTSNQMFQGGSTTNLARRQNVICRLYVNDNVSLTTADGLVEGTRPFIINRQYYNARIMKWSTENAVPTIDIQLYDDCGQPLEVTWQPRPYQITFNAYERARSDNSDDPLDDSGLVKPKNYATYHEGNVSKAWTNLKRHQ
jgi:hypothetical protein